MCPCLRYTCTGKECKISTLSDCCGECVRLGTPCNLAVSSSEFNRVEQQIDKLQQEESLARESKKELKAKVSEVQAKVSEVQAKVSEVRSCCNRICQQLAALRKCHAELVRLKLQNIEELEAEEAQALQTIADLSPTFPSGWLDVLPSIDEDTGDAVDGSPARFSAE